MSNQAPVVNAGEDAVVTLPLAELQTQGSVQDDGLPSGSALVVSWTKISGPGQVNFDNPAALNTRVQFKESGEYILRLSADDGEFVIQDDVKVLVDCPLEPLPMDVCIAVDHSGSMGGGAGSKLDAARRATKEFIRNINPFYDRVALFTFDTVSPNTALTSDIALLTSRVDTLAGGSSDFGAGITYSQTHLDATARPDVARIILIVADGQTSRVPVITAANAAKAKGSRIVCLGIGEGADEALLREAASSPSDYYFIPQASDVAAVFAALSRSFCRYEGAVVKAFAGPDQVLGGESRSVELKGYVDFTGVPAAVTRQISWSKVSGPGVVTFSDSSNAVATATFSEAGVYILKLRGEAQAIDGLMASDDYAVVRVDTPCEIEAPEGLAAWFTG
ncbi:MAG: VWA domain-containing protein, partial [Verrucomicrobiaceae bacterium]